jgi:hypothetical protein
MPAPVKRPIPGRARSPPGRPPGRVKTKWCPVRQPPQRREDRGVLLADQGRLLGGRSR